MKQLIFLTGLLLQVVYSYSAPQWQWGLNGSCATDDEGDVIARDKAGNIYVAGTFTGILSLESTTLSSVGGKDIFIAKYSATGQLLWAKNGGSIADEMINAISIDSADNIYIAGSFGGHTIYPVTYTDTAYFSGNSIASNGNTDIFIGKYNAAGNIQWLKSYGSSNNDIVAGIAITTTGQIIFTGDFNLDGSSPAMIVFGTSSLTSANGHLYIVCAEANNGNVDWAKQYKNVSSGVFSGLKIDSSNNIYLRGYLNSHATFDAYTISSISSGFVVGDLFLVKFNPSGNALWAKPIGGNNTGTSTGGAIYPGEISVSFNGSLYLTGFYGGCSLKFHNGMILPYQDQFQIFLAKYNTQGNLIWAKEMGGDSWDYSYGLHLDKDQNVYLTGSFHDKAHFGTDTIIGYGADDAFVTKYDSLGYEQWVVNMGGSSDEIGYGITGTEDGSSLYVTGAFSSSTFHYGSSTIANSGGWDMFLLKLSQSAAGIHAPIYTNDEVSIYPNPTTGIVNIRSKSKDYTTVKVYDQLGREVFSAATNKSNYQPINLSMLPDGLYYMQFSGKEKMVTKKIIIEH